MKASGSRTPGIDDNAAPLVYVRFRAGVPESHLGQQRREHSPAASGKDADGQHRDVQQHEGDVVQGRRALIVYQPEYSNCAEHDHLRTVIGVSTVRGCRPPAPCFGCVDDETTFPACQMTCRSTPADEPEELAAASVKARNV